MCLPIYFFGLDAGDLWPSSSLQAPSCLKSRTAIQRDRTDCRICFVFDQLARCMRTCHVTQMLAEPHGLRARISFMQLRISAMSIWRRKLCSPSKIPSGQKCYLCLRNNLLPMCPGWTRLGGGRGIRTPVHLPAQTVFKTAAFNHSAIPPATTLADCWDYPQGWARLLQGGASKACRRAAGQSLAPLP